MRKGVFSIGNSSLKIKEKLMYFWIEIKIENVFYTVNPINFPILIEESYINDEIKTDCELINDLPVNLDF